MESSSFLKKQQIVKLKTSFLKQLLLFLLTTREATTVIISALQNNSFFGSSPFLSNKWKEETKLSQSVKERERTGEREMVCGF